jgi:hypothetical protein
VPARLPRQPPPVIWYQIGDKFRDEPDPACCAGASFDEDSYSFDVDSAGTATL